MKLKPIIFIGLISAFIYADSACAQLKTRKTPKQVFVLDRDGAGIKQSPDRDSQTIAVAQFGQRLDVIKAYKTWLEITDPNTRQVGYVKIVAVVADQTKIPLTNSDLAEIYRFDPADTTNRYPNFELKLISKKQFYAMKKTAVNYFSADTNVIKKHKRTIRLPLKKGYKLLIDKADDNKIDSNINSYMGQYPMLNKYVIFNCDGAAEECSYYFVDKTTGTFSDFNFNDFPYLSNDKKFLLSIHANDYENYADLSVEKLPGKAFQEYAGGQFRNWMPAQSNDQFWGSDGCFYLPVIPSVVYYQSFYSKKPPGYNFRYIKIKIKGPSKLPKY